MLCKFLEETTATVFSGFDLREESARSGVMSTILRETEAGGYDIADIGGTGGIQSES